MKERDKAMPYGKIEAELDGPVGIIRLSEPETLNATSYQMLDEFNEAISEITAKARSLILTGAGRAFCSGAGLSDFDGGAGKVPDYGRGLETHINPILTRLRGLHIPWVSAVRGAAAGVGCSFALAADLIVASENAYFVQAFAKVGLVPDGGATYLLPRHLSRARAMEMMLLGDKIPAAQALEWGMINRVVPDDQLESTALALARRLADGPTEALKMIRRNAWSGLESSWEMALHVERESQRIAGLTADFDEGIAAFKEKRKPQFKGR
jgi:2-(1,2-epoxy-1,2-dihydrophenyl)acetyl-CoA isomerase